MSNEVLLLTVGSLVLVAGALAIYVLVMMGDGEDK